MENFGSQKIMKVNTLKKHKKTHKDYTYKFEKKNTHYNHKSNSNNNIIKKSNSNKYDKISLQKDLKRNLSIFNTNYKINLFNKFYEFLNKKKFKLLNNFDAKNSKKFLDKKDKCLERIILPDLIETNDSSKDDNLILYDNKKKEFETQKNINKYFIIISNYDEEIKNKSVSKKNIYKIKI